MMTNRLLEIVPTVLPQVRSNRRVKITANVVIFQNAGNINARLENGWTLKPGEKLSMGGWAELNMIPHEFLISFEGNPPNGEEPDPLVEIMVMNVANIHKLDDYIIQPTPRT